MLLGCIIVNRVPEIIETPEKEVFDPVTGHHFAEVSLSSGNSLVESITLVKSQQVSVCSTISS